MYFYYKVNKDVKLLENIEKYIFVFLTQSYYILYTRIHV